MKKWFMLVLVCFLAGCNNDPGTGNGNGKNPGGEPPFTGLTSIDEVESLLYLSNKGSSPDDPVVLSVKISASEWVQLFDLIKRKDKFVALDISHCYDAPKEFTYRMENYGDKIVSMSLPMGITSTTNNAFIRCTNLKQITLPEGLTQIGSSDFSGCTNLEQITLPASITRIRDDAFHNCTSLVLVICHATTPPRLDYEVFGGASDELVIKVPAASAEAYKAAWNDFPREYADKITAY